MTEVHDLLIHRTNEDPCNALKTQLIKHTATADQQKLQQLLSIED